MASDAAKLLDELMGRDRNIAPTDKGRSRPNFDDPEVCKYFLCGYCPHDLFVNTRADLGDCSKVHDEMMRERYEKSSRNGTMGYEEDFLSFLQSLLSDVEKRIQKGRSRLALNNSQAAMGSAPHVQKEEKIEMLTQRINDLVEQAEELGCEGKVEEAQGVLRLCEQLRDEREQLSSVSNFHQTLQPKEMEVCEVCGAFLVMGDAQQRVEEHLLGKQHMGYGKVRDTIEQLKRKIRGEPSEEMLAKRAKEREERDKERAKEREDRDKEREKRHKERAERDKGKDRERDDRRKKRSKSRSKRSRSRSRSRRHRSRSRDRKHRRRSRSRGEHSKRSRTHRSRSRDDRRRSSRDRSRGRHSRDKGKSLERSNGEAHKSSAGPEAKAPEVKVVSSDSRNEDATGEVNEAGDHRSGDAKVVEKPMDIAVEQKEANADSEQNDVKAETSKNAAEQNDVKVDAEQSDVVKVETEQSDCKVETKQNEAKIEAEQNDENMDAERSDVKNDAEQSDDMAMDSEQTDANENGGSPVSITEVEQSDTKALVPQLGENDPTSNEAAAVVEEQDEPIPVSDDTVTSPPADEVRVCEVTAE